MITSLSPTPSSSTTLMLNVRIAFSNSLLTRFVAVVGYPFLHWGVLNIPADVLSLYEGQGTNKRMPTGSFEIFNPIVGAEGYASFSFGIQVPMSFSVRFRLLSEILFS